MATDASTLPLPPTSAKENIVCRVTDIKELSPEATAPGGALPYGPPARGLSSPVTTDLSARNKREITKRIRGHGDRSKQGATPNANQLISRTADDPAK